MFDKGFDKEILERCMILKRGLGLPQRTHSPYTRHEPFLFDYLFTVCLILLWLNKGLLITKLFFCIIKKRKQKLRSTLVNSDCITSGICWHFKNAGYTKSIYGCRTAYVLIRTVVYSVYSLICHTFLSQLPKRRTALSTFDQFHNMWLATQYQTI